MRILVTGTRDPTLRMVQAFRQALLDEVGGADPGSVTIVHGAARGVDAVADGFAKQQGWRVERHPAPWRTGGQVNRDAGFVRNADMVATGADVCVAAAGKWASGTGHCARLARKAGIRVVDVGVDTTPVM